MAIELEEEVYEVYETYFHHLKTVSFYPIYLWLCSALSFVALLLHEVI